MGEGERGEVRRGLGVRVGVGVRMRMGRRVVAVDACGEAAGCAEGCYTGWDCIEGRRRWEEGVDVRVEVVDVV